MSDQKAFTLIEMLVVIAIIGILASFVAFQLIDNINEGKDVKRKADIELLANAVVSYSSDHYSSKPITDADGCTINNDCDSTINDALKSYLPTLPDDPSGTHYIYQSNGNDCTISASLSDGTTYQYSCAEEKTTAGAPTPGVCGTSHNSNSYTEPTSNFCSDGTIPTVSVSSTGWTWSCPGSYLGSSVTCIANKSVDGTCGTAVKTTATAYADSATSFGSDTICNTGTPSKTVSFPAKGGSDSWDCLGLYDGLSTTDSACKTYHSANGVCGTSSNGNYYLSSEITAPCESGTATISGSGSPTGYFTWSCPPIYSGTSTSCTANLKVDGVCGSSGLYTSLSSGVCSSGTSVNFSGGSSGPWSWSCAGLNGGGSSGICSAVYGLNGICYSNYTPEGTCVQGSPSGVTFTDYSKVTATWTCSGLGAGYSTTCTTPALLFGGLHTSSQCFSVSNRVGGQGDGLPLTSSNNYLVSAPAWPAGVSSSTRPACLFNLPGPPYAAQLPSSVPAGWNCYLIYGCYSTNSWSPLCNIYMCY